ncbi:hypothetical protein PGB90_006810 [Kerria lacca]
MCSCSKSKLLVVLEAANALESIERRYWMRPFNEKREEEERFLQINTRSHHKEEYIYAKWDMRRRTVDYPILQYLPGDSSLSPFSLNTVTVTFFSYVP